MRAGARLRAGPPPQAAGPRGPWSCAVAGGAVLTQMLRLPRQPLFHLTGLGPPWRWGWGPRSTSTQGRGPGRGRQGRSEPRLCTWPCSRPPGTALAARAPLLQAGAPASGLQREGLLGRLAERGLRVELALGSGRCRAGGSEAAMPRSALGAVGWAVPGGGAGTGRAGDGGRPGLHPHLSPGSQVLFNMAAAQCRLGLWAEATRSLEEAIAKGPEGACDLNTALGQVQVRGRARGQARGRERGTRPALPSQAPELTQGPAARSVALTSAQTPQTNYLTAGSFWRVVAACPGASAAHGLWEVGRAPGTPSAAELRAAAGAGLVGCSGLHWPDLPPETGLAAASLGPQGRGLPAPQAVPGAPGPHGFPGQGQGKGAASCFSGPRCSVASSTGRPEGAGGQALVHVVHVDGRPRWAGSGHKAGGSVPRWGSQTQGLGAGRRDPPGAARRAGAVPGGATVATACPASAGQDPGGRSGLSPEAGQQHHCHRAPGTSSAPGAGHVWGSKDCGFHPKV